MPGQTSRAALRYPIGTDSPDVPRDITDLANDSDLLTARLLAAVLQEGVVGNSNQATVATGQAVSVSAGLAIIADDATPWTLTPVYQAAATIVTFNASHGSLPRLDQVYKTLIGTLVYVPGTATSGATLDNRSGNNDAGAPANSIRLCDVLIPAASSQVNSSNIRDRRLRANGIHTIMNGSMSGADIGTFSTAGVAVDSGDMSRRNECSGVPLQICFMGHGYVSAAGGSLYLSHQLDGALAGSLQYFDEPTANNIFPISHRLEISPSPGSHLYRLMVAPGGTGAYSATVVNRSAADGRWPQVVLREIIPPSLDNGQL